VEPADSRLGNRYSQRDYLAQRRSNSMDDYNLRAARGARPGHAPRWP